MYKTVIKRHYPRSWAGWCISKLANLVNGVSLNTKTELERRNYRKSINLVQSTLSQWTPGVGPFPAILQSFYCNLTLLWDAHLSKMGTRGRSRWCPSNLVPRAFFSFKMAVGETPGQAAAELLHESRLSRDTWWNGFFGVRFQRLAALFVFCNRKPLFEQNEDISSCLRVEILTNFWSHFGSLGQGFLRQPFWTRRRPWERRWEP